MKEATPMIDRLKVMKEKSGMTYQDIAKASNIPESTVTRIFSGKTLNPTITTVEAIVSAMGGDLSDLFDKKVLVNLDPKSDEVIQVQEPYTQVKNPDANPESYKMETISLEHHREVVEMYKNAMVRKDKWLKVMAIALGVLVCAFVGFVIFDLMNPSIGYLTQASY